MTIRKAVILTLNEVKGKDLGFPFDFAQGKLCPYSPQNDKK
jgi:hypothetical protein